MFNIITWNVKSLRSARRRGRVKKWISLCKPDIVVFQETLLPSCSDFIVNQIWGSKACEWRALDSIGRSGGILCIWNPNVVSIQSDILGVYSINMHFVTVNDNFHWLFSAVYGPCDTMERKYLWEELQLMRLIWNLPWCIGGDFNEVRLMRERQNCSKISRGMQDFIEFCDNKELIDLPISGAKFTWKSGNANQSKLNRFVISGSWEDHFHNVVVTALARPFSDHKPIKLSCDSVDWGPPPWRFEAMWWFEKDFILLLKNWWSSLSFHGSPGFVMSKKLQALKAILKTWNREVFGKIDRKCEDNLLAIKALDQLGEDRQLAVSQEAKLTALKLDFEKLADMQETHYKQKYRTNWQIKGEINTHFFHRIIKNRRRRNFVASLKINGVVVEDKQAIKHEIVSHFESRFKVVSSLGFSVANMPLRKISVEEASNLEKPILEEEVFSALKMLGQDKAPGPDGLQISVVVKCWEFMKSDIMRVVKHFERNAFVDWRLKSTFISLIPKKPIVEEVKDLRPISLTSCIYKVISKVLAERLKPLLPKITSPNQTAFVKGKQILDSNLVANECLDSRLKSKNPGVICKIDLEKAFDNVRWSCIDEVLIAMGFGSRWRTWIQGCVSRVPFSVLVNGSVCGKFKREGNPSRGSIIPIPLPVGF